MAFQILRDDLEEDLKVWLNTEDSGRVLDLNVQYGDKPAVCLLYIIFSEGKVTLNHLDSKEIEDLNGLLKFDEAGYVLFGND